MKWMSSWTSLINFDIDIQIDPRDIPFDRFSRAHENPIPKMWLDPLNIICLWRLYCSSLLFSLNHFYALRLAPCSTVESTQLYTLFRFWFCSCETHSTTQWIVFVSFCVFFFSKTKYHRPYNGAIKPIAIKVIVKIVVKISRKKKIKNCCV